MSQSILFRFWMILIYEGDEIIIGCAVVLEEVQEDVGIGLIPHVDIKIDKFLISPDQGGSTAEYGSVNHAVLLLVDIIHKHVIGLYVHLEIKILEMLVVESQVHSSAVAELVLDLDIPQSDGPGIQEDGVVESIIGIQVICFLQTIVAFWGIAA